MKSKYRCILKCYDCSDKNYLACAKEYKEAREEDAMHSKGLVENGRVVNPFNKDERPTFLPGDKVKDVRDSAGKIWRIVRRAACNEDDELMTLREVGDDTNEITVCVKELMPYLRMVAMSKIA